MRVIVFTRAGCQPCRTTKRAFGHHGVLYKEIDVEERPDTVGALRDWYGYRELPIVLVHTDEGSNHDNWSGFRPDKIKELANG